MAIGTYISIITLNVNGLNTPTKRHRLAQTRPVYMLSTRITLNLTTYIDMEKYIPYANGKQKKAGIAISYQTK